MEQLKLNYAPAAHELNSTSFYVNTHLGSSRVSDLGITLVHEHVFNRFPEAKKSISETFTINKLKALERHGVGTIVDLTPYTNLSRYKTVLDYGELQIICCIGFYLAKYVPYTYKRAKTPELIRFLSNQIDKSIKGTTIKPGILKVAAKGADLSALEHRLFECIGALHCKYKLPIATHSPKGALVHVNKLARCGVNLNHVFVSHVEQGITSSHVDFEKRLAEILEIINMGAYVVFTDFGNGGPKSKKAAAITKILTRLKELNCIEKILISSDSNWRWRNGSIRIKDERFGGVPKTYEYLFLHTIPLLKNIGLTDRDISTMLVDNPQKLFSVN